MSLHHWVQWSRPDRPSRVSSLGRELAGPHGYRFESRVHDCAVQSDVSNLPLSERGIWGDGGGLEVEANHGMVGWWAGCTPYP